MLSESGQASLLFAALRELLCHAALDQAFSRPSLHQLQRRALRRSRSPLSVWLQERWPRGHGISAHAMAHSVLALLTSAAAARCLGRAHCRAIQAALARRYAIAMAGQWDASTTKTTTVPKSAAPPLARHGQLCPCATLAATRCTWPQLWLGSATWYVLAAQGFAAFLETQLLAEEGVLAPS